MKLRHDRLQRLLVISIGLLAAGGALGAGGSRGQSSELIAPEVEETPYTLHGDSIKGFDVVEKIRSPKNYPDVDWELRLNVYISYNAAHPEVNVSVTTESNPPGAIHWGYSYWGRPSENHMGQVIEEVSPKRLTLRVPRGGAETTFVIVKLWGREPAGERTYLVKRFPFRHFWEDVR